MDLTSQYIVFDIVNVEGMPTRTKLRGVKFYGVFSCKQEAEDLQKKIQERTGRLIYIKSIII